MRFYFQGGRPDADAPCKPDFKSKPLVASVCCTFLDIPI